MKKEHIVTSILGLAVIILSLLFLGSIQDYSELSMLYENLSDELMKCKLKIENLTVENRKLYDYIFDLNRNLSAWKWHFGDKEWLLEDPYNIRSETIEIEEELGWVSNCEREFKEITGIEEKFYCTLFGCSPRPLIAKEKGEVIKVYCSCYCTWLRKEEKSWRPIPECKGHELCWFAKIKRVIDGDTLEIGRDVIKLALTNAPEEGEVGYEEAKDFARRLCLPGSYAFIDVDDKRPRDAYDRIIATVYCNGKNLNAELLYNDLAKIDKRFCDRSEFSSEKWAKDHGC